MLFSKLPTLMGIVYCSMSLSAACAEDDDRPNIIVIYADDHAQHAISAYGSQINATPNIDQLAADGVRFTQSFVANSICGPARATLLTGLHSHANGQIDNKAGFKDDLPTFAKLLQSHGYDTAVVGKWHLPTLPNGFDFWAIKKGDFYNCSFETASGIEASHGHVTDAITKLTLDWIAHRDDTSKPFMAWISHSAVHRTWSPAIRHLNHYDDVTIPEPQTLFDDYQGRAKGAAKAQMRISRDLFPAYDLKLPITGEEILDDVAERHLARMSPVERKAWQAAYVVKNRKYAEANLSGDALTRWKHQRYVKDYLRCVDGLDESVSSVRSFLASNGLTENTIVIYTADQGFFLGEHGWYDKRWMYEESLCTPMIIYWPGQTKPGATIDAMVQNIDLAPTILEMAGVQRSAPMHGRSLVPWLKGMLPDSWRNSIYYHYQMEEPLDRTSHLVAKHYGIRTKRYKLIYFYDLDQWELYDLKADQQEMNNLAGDTAYASKFSELRSQLREQRIVYNDTTGIDFGD